MFKNKIIREINDYYKNLWALSYASAVVGWDLETYMPPLSAPSRGEAMGRISVIKQKMFLDSSFVKLIHSAENIEHLTDEERGIVRVLQHAIKFYTRIPSDFLEKFEKVTSKATMDWREAKSKDNFKIFEGSLTKIFDMNKEMAEYLGYKDSPYDALLDQYEEGLTSNSVNQFFNEVNKPLRELLNKIVNSPKYFKSHPLETAKYDKEKMRELNNKVLKLLWKDYGQNFRLDVSTHPFTTSFSKNDTRITTWYHDADFGRSILAVIHEFGHALYDLQCSQGLEMTPIAGGSSLVIHESQSRFWENFVGRSESFIENFLPDMEKAVDCSLSTESVYMYFNKVRPGLLRVEADEVTYHFHIMLRYEIEKGIIEGKLKVKDLPEIWNAKMKEYLGITPKRASDGALQDIHWSMGSVGYFPTYSLGTFLGAQWEDRIENSELIINNYKQVEKWLGEHIHQYGSTYTLEDLLKKNKMVYDPKVNLKYLEAKYSKIYGF
jgi:carboxypeptidase Taq